MLKAAGILAEREFEITRVIELLENFQGSEYELRYVQELHYEVLLSYNKDKAGLFLNNNLDNPELRPTAIKIAISKKNYQKTKQIAYAGIKHNRYTSPGYVSMWQQWLLYIARK